jgi:pyruvate dehydrogenase E2 component (dihydrolipoamide acetyltransferase)
VAITITVPRLGWSMEEGTFAGWLKQDGDRVSSGDRLFALESEKATEEVETLDGGILRIPPDAPQPGDTVRVGQALGYLVAEGESAPAQLGTIQAPSASAGTPTQAPSASAGTTVPLASASGLYRGKQAPSASAGIIAQPAASAGRRRAVSPRARRVAAELGVDCAAVTGSGRNGRIRERDVRAAAGATGGRLLPHTDTRRTIAARMVAGVTQAAPVTLTTRADATNLVNLRGQFKAAAVGPDDVVPGYTDFLVKLAAVALRRHPLLQARWRDDGLFVPDHVAVAVAVDTDAGLLAPVIRDADRLTLREVAARSHDLVARARAGRLTAAEMRDATFTITNLGGLGVDAFTPILHLPQCAVLGVGRIAREPAVVGEHVVPRDQVTLSLTFDHRVVDGAPAARFLDTLRGCLEQPAPWLMP